MAIVQRGSATSNSQNNGNDLTLTLPTGLQENDVVIVGYAMNAAGTGGTSSSGWTTPGRRPLSSFATANRCRSTP